MMDSFDDNIPRLYKPKSNVWKYFSEDIDQTGKPVMRCCFCSVCFSSGTSKNATKLRQHLILRCAHIPEDVKELMIGSDKSVNISTNTSTDIGSNDNQTNNKLRAKQQSPKLVVKTEKSPVSDQTKYHKLKEENFKLNSRLKISLKQNEALINITRYMSECIELLKRIDSLKTDDRDSNESEIIGLNKQLDMSDELVNEWRIKYQSIDSQEKAKNDIFRTSGHKPQSSIWKYYKFVENDDSDGYKTIKCSFCDKMFRQKVLNAYKCRTHIVDRCGKCPEHIRQEEDILVEPQAKSKINIWEHFIVSDEEGKAVTECSYCGIIYSGKNATKCREHLVSKCEKIPSDVKETICSQCDDDFLLNVQNNSNKPKFSIWEYYNISEDEGRISCRCVYCGTIYAHKNATKCREHLVDRCDQIPADIRTDITNQCEEFASRTWTQSKIPVWDHYIITEDDGKIMCECSYCGLIYSSKNATKCRLHLIKCIKIPIDIKEEVINESGESLETMLKKTSTKKYKEVKKRKLYVKSEMGRAGRPKCQIWQYFTEDSDQSGNTTRRCVYCDTSFGFRTSRNATKLRDHLAVNCKLIPQDVKQNVDIEDGFVRSMKDTINQNKPLDRRYQCCWPGCELSFPKRSRLLKHQLVHTGNIVRIKCDWPGCDWTGRDRFSVKMHRYRHTGEKPWTCDWPGCDFKTAKPSSLYIHKLRHNNLKKFKCEWPGCERDFLTNSQRKVHKMVHLGIKPYACPYCDKRFPQPNKLKLHQNKHHSNEEINK